MRVRQGTQRPLLIAAVFDGGDGGSSLPAHKSIEKNANPNREKLGGKGNLPDLFFLPSDDSSCLLLFFALVMRAIIIIIIIIIIIMMISSFAVLRGKREVGLSF